MRAGQLHYSPFCLHSCLCKRKLSFTSGQHSAEHTTHTHTPQYALALSMAAALKTQLQPAPMQITSARRMRATARLTYSPMPSLFLRVHNARTPVPTSQTSHSGYHNAPSTSHLPAHHCDGATRGLRDSLVWYAVGGVGVTPTS